jgi:hypothetical protein
VPDVRPSSTSDPAGRRRDRRPIALAVLWLVLVLLAVACGSSSSTAGPSAGDVGQPDQSGLSSDEPIDAGDGSVDEPPTLAPVPSGAKAKPACDAAYKAWVDWWQASAAADNQSDPNASPAEEPSGDPYELERIAFEKCTIEDMAIANARHPVILDPEESPVPYIDYDVRTFAQDTCQIDADIIGDTVLCQRLPSPSP